MKGTQVAAERAARFVAEHGGAAQRARARAIRGEAGAEAALEQVADPAPGDLAALERALSVCDEVRGLRSPLAQRTCAAIAALQHPDGAFGGPADPAEARLQRTGGIGGVLARSPFVRPFVLSAAGAFLAVHFTPDLFQGFRYANVAAYAGFFANALHEAADEILQWCGRELERGFRERQFSALDTTAVLLRCDAHAIPGARLDPEELLLSLLAEQASDGSFGTARARAERIEVTLTGLRALAFLAGARGLDSPGTPR